MSAVERLIRSACKLRLDALHTEQDGARARWQADQETPIAQLPVELRRSVRRYLGASAVLAHERTFLHRRHYSTPVSGIPVLARLRRSNGTSPEEVKRGEQFGARRAAVARIQQTYAEQALDQRKPEQQRRLLERLADELKAV